MAPRSNHANAAGWLRPYSDRPGIGARFKSNPALITLCASLFLVACSQNPPPDPPGPPGPPGPPASGNLYLSLSDDAQGLHVVDTVTGAATAVGSGETGVASSSPGLAPSSLLDRLYGTSDFQLALIKRDGSGWTPVGDQGALSEGLAYDPEDDVLYAASNGFLHVRSPATGLTLETWLQPPNQPDIEGLAFDPETRTLYGLARGHQVQPEFYQDLYALNVDDAILAWSSVGSTGGLWERAGLAFDVEAGVLYATGRQGDLGGLYRIDPDNGATTRVGDTGLVDAAGGLAWVP